MVNRYYTDGLVVFHDDPDDPDVFKGVGYADSREWAESFAAELNHLDREIERLRWKPASDYPALERYIETDSAEAFKASRLVLYRCDDEEHSHHAWYVNDFDADYIGWEYVVIRDGGRFDDRQAIIVHPGDKWTELPQASETEARS